MVPAKLVYWVNSILAPRPPPGQVWQSCISCAWILSSRCLSRKSYVTWPASLRVGGRSARLAHVLLGELGMECRERSLTPGLVSYEALAFSFRWEVQVLAPCPVTCGGGWVPVAVHCMQLDHGRPVSLPHSKCWPVPRPSPFKDCNPEPCPNLTYP